jgi:hypothetical protein
MAGQVVGAGGISGAVSAHQDEEIAIAVVNALQSTQARANAMPTFGARPAEDQVTYIGSRKVAEGFAKGAVLVDNGEVMMHASRNYMVHASRHEAPGMAAIHTLDTDIIYVLEGTATLVTGSTAVDAKTTAANELRGTAIRDGESRRLAKGDVMIIPNGVPHWFQEVQGPFLYYVVKVR